MRSLVPPWWPDDDEPVRVWSGEHVDVPEVESDPNPVVARLLGPDGSPLVELLARAQLSLGFHPGKREPSRLVRHYPEEQR